MQKVYLKIFTNSDTLLNLNPRPLLHLESCNMLQSSRCNVQKAMQIGNKKVPFQAAKLGLIQKGSWESASSHPPPTKCVNLTCLDVLWTKNYIDQCFPKSPRFCRLTGHCHLVHPSICSMHIDRGGCARAKHQEQTSQNHDCMSNCSERMHLIVSTVCCIKMTKICNHAKTLVPPIHFRSNLVKPSCWD